MQSLSIMHIALGGCLRAEPRYGLTEDTGGHITYILGEARALARRSDVAACEIVTRLFDAPELGEVHAVPAEDVAPGLVITRIDSGDRRYLCKEALAADRTAFTRALIANLRSRPRLPDVIHAHFSDAADVALRVREALGIPVIYTPHSLGRDKQAATGAQPGDLAARLAEEDRAIAQSDAVIASSRDECERQLSSYPGARIERIWRVHPGIDQTQASADDIEAGRELVAPFLRDPARPMVLAIARPVRKKNLAGLVEAFARHDALRSRANLVILPGLRRSIDGGEAEQSGVMRDLVDRIDRHDLHGSVAYPRRHDHSSVRGLYALAARSGGVFCNPALVEPFGLTILESAVHGLPVVATHRGGPVDIVGEIGHGLLVDPEDPAALGEGLHAMIADPVLHRECAARARRNIAAVTWDRYADQFAAIARRMVKPTRPVAQTRSVQQPHTLLLCDIDNTLTGCRKSAATLASYLAARPHIAFGIATGRSLPEARRLMLEWSLPEPAVWITSVGTEIYWRQDGELVADRAYADCLAAGWDAPAIDRFMQARAHVQPQSGIEQRTYKRSYLCQRADIVGALRKALRANGIAARVVYSHGRLLDILPHAGGKGAATRHVARRLGLPLERVMVAGDSGNDTDMIRACPNAIVVANCEDALRRAGREHGAFMATRPHAAGVLEGLMAFALAEEGKSAA